MKNSAIAILILSVLLMIPQTGRAGDAFVKFGMALNKLEESFDAGDRWQIGFGSDWKIADTVGIGFEVQFAYRKYETVILVPPGEVQVNYRSIPLNFFGNIKLKPGFEGSVHPYVGAGAGIMGSLNSAKADFSDIAIGTINNNFDGGIHLMGGIELGSKDSAAFLVEFELSRPLRDSAENLYVLYGGVRF